MLCCAGLIGGIYVGQSLGGSWTVIAPAAGFGAGLLADMKFMHGKRSHSPDKSEKERNHNHPPSPESQKNT